MAVTFRAKIFFIRDSSEITIDAVQNYDNSVTATVTTHKVEDGSDINDHIAVNPRTFSLSGTISGLRTGGSKSDPQKADERFLKALENKEPVRVYTKKRVYNDIYISRYSESKSLKNTEALVFSLEFTPVRTVTTQTTKIAPAAIKEPPTQKRFSPKETKGQKPTKPATASQQTKQEAVKKKTQYEPQKSWAASLSEKLGFR